MFKEEYYVANGHNGKYFKTFFDVDPRMKVYEIDNIVFTKNLKIKHIDSFETDLSDHSLFWVELEI